MDIEWAKDGLNNQLYIVQATRNDLWRRKNKFEIYKLKERTIITKGIA
jgi:pyruvate,water dikinase